MIYGYNDMSQVLYPSGTKLAFAFLCKQLVRPRKLEFFLKLQQVINPGVIVNKYIIKKYQDKFPQKWFKTKFTSV